MRSFICLGLIAVILSVSGNVFAETITLGGSAACKKLKDQLGVAHMPDPDVTMNALKAFKPDQIIRIPVKVESLEAFGVDTSAFAGLAVEPDLGAIELYPDGRIFYNGQEINAQRMDEFCQMGSEALSAKQQAQ